jgi:predicted nucleotidyltransferase
MQTIKSDAINKKIVEYLKSDPSIVKIILFGSYVSGNPNKDSDIDIVVLLNEKGINATYRERLNRIKRISRLLDPIRAFIALDILVFTIDEWNYLIKKDSLFVKDIKKKGYNLI